MQGFLELLKANEGILLKVFWGVNIVAFIMYGIDKKRAINGEWRIRERTLLLIGFFGGAVGSLVGMKVFRHKTLHWYFWVVNIIGLSWQLVPVMETISGGELSKFMTEGLFFVL